MPPPITREETILDRIVGIVVLGKDEPHIVDWEQSVVDALEANGRHDIVKREYDALKIAVYGALQLPALVVDGKVVAEGTKPSDEELRALFVKKEEK